MAHHSRSTFKKEKRKEANCRKYNAAISLPPSPQKKKNNNDEMGGELFPLTKLIVNAAYNNAIEFCKMIRDQTRITKSFRTKQSHQSDNPSWEFCVPCHMLWSLVKPTEMTNRSRHIKIKYSVLIQEMTSALRS